MMKKLILFTLVLFFFYSPLSAVNVYWLGGTGNWDNPTKWSTGSIPTLDDDVFINSGTVTVTAAGCNANHAATVRVLGVLNINAGASLYVSDQQASYGVYCDGTINVSGTLRIDDIDNGDGLKNLNNIVVNAGGSITVRDVKFAAISNYGSITNDGRITLGPNLVWGIEIYPYSSLLNRIGGVFTVTGATDKAIQLLGYDTELFNDGEMNIYDSGTAISASAGVFGCGSTGEINISDCIYGINLKGYHQFINLGKISMETTQLCLFVAVYGGGAPSFENGSTGQLSMGNLAGTTMQFNSGAISVLNRGSMQVKSSGYSYSLDNSCSSFVNYPCANLSFIGKIRNSSTGTIQNNGWMTVVSDLPSINQGTFTNNGVLQDNDGSLTGIITNNRVIARTAQGPLVANTLVSNFMELGSWSGFVCLGVYTKPNGTNNAGTYNANTNIYVPNIKGAGKDVIYIKIRDYAGGCDAVFQVDILPSPSPIAPPTNPAEIREANESERSIEGSLQPNPSTGAFQISIPDASPGDCDILIFNTLGQLVHQQQNDFSASPILSVDAAAQWSGGVYEVKIVQQGRPIWQTPLLLTR